MIGKMSRAYMKNDILIRLVGMSFVVISMMTGPVQLHTTKWQSLRG